MKARAVRIKVDGRVPAAFAGQPCELVDISVTGALVVVGVELPLGSEHPFQLGEDTEALGLSGRVVRLLPAAVDGQWQTAMAFEALTPTLQRAISSGVCRLLAAPRRRSTPLKLIAG